MERPLAPAQARALARARQISGVAALAVAACILPACAIPVPGGGAAGTRAGAGAGADAPPTTCAATAGQQVLAAVNAVRARHGLAALVPDVRLVEAARLHSRDQAAVGGSMGHIGSDGSAPGDRLAAAGYDWAMVSENVAAGYATAAAVVAAWLDSPPHRSTILSPGAVHAGIGYVGGSPGSMRHFWTLDVASPRAGGGGGGADGSRACHP